MEIYQVMHRICGGLKRLFEKRIRSELDRCVKKVCDFREKITKKT